MIELLFSLDLQLNEHLIDRAWKDPEFQQRLLSHPHQTLEVALNAKIPKNIDYQVLKDTVNHFHLILPYLANDVNADQRQAIYQQAASTYEPSWQAELVRLFGKAENPEFRQKLLDNPKTMLSKFLGLALPDEIKITLLENTPQQRYLILPHDSMKPTKKIRTELSEFNIALLAGGVSNTVYVAIMNYPRPAGRRC